VAGGAASAKLRSEALAKFLDDWQAEHGAFTAELAEAEASFSSPGTLA